jgi:O-antigen/teichoic acid export membrane protein
VVQFVEAALKVALAYIVFESGRGMVGLMTVFLATRLLTGILYLAVIQKMVKRVPAGVSADSVMRILHCVPTFAGLYIFSVLFSKIDLMMLSLLKNFNDVGIYSAAYKLLEISFILPTCVVTVIFPILSRCAREAPDTIGKTSCRAAAYSTVALVPVVILAMIFAENIMSLIYSKGFIESVVPFRILIVTLGLYMIDQIFAHTLVASNFQKLNLKVVIAGTVLNLSANIVLIPRYSYIGASIATLMSMMFVSAAHFYCVRKYLVCGRALEVSMV